MKKQKKQYRKYAQKVWHIFGNNIENGHECNNR